MKLQFFDFLKPLTQISDPNYRGGGGRWMSKPFKRNRIGRKQMFQISGPQYDRKDLQSCQCFGVQGMHFRLVNEKKKVVNPNLYSMPRAHVYYLEQLGQPFEVISILCGHLAVCLKNKYDSTKTAALILPTTLSLQKLVYYLGEMRRKFGKKSTLEKESKWIKQWR